VEQSSGKTIRGRLVETVDALTARIGVGWEEVIREHLTRLAREVWADGCRHLPSGRPMHSGYAEGEGAEQIAATARRLFPLPPKRVLREGRVKDEDDLPVEPFLYRVNVEGSGEVEWCDPREDAMDTRKYVWRPLNLSAAPAPNAARIRLWADLLARPYREEPQ
jgi:hypothetical protein